MNKSDIAKFIDSFSDKKDHTIVIVDYGNVEKWKHSLGWKIGIRELAQLAKCFSGKQFLRRFYYGSDYGFSEKSVLLDPWSAGVLNSSRNNNLEVVTKRVKYIRDSANKYGYSKKCDLDVEMVVDLIKERECYDTIILFSGDGDLMCGVRYLKEEFNKNCMVFGARDHIGREVFDAKKEGVVSNVLYAEDFEYRLNEARRPH